MNPFDNDNFAKHLGLEIVEVKDGIARAKMPVRQEILNGAGIVHGGAIYSLAVWALALAANDSSKDDAISVGVGSSINYISNVSSGCLYAAAKPVNVGRTLSTYHSTVTDDNGNVIAVLQGSAYHKYKKNKSS
ncbi:MAG: PaaI family thioesterase [Sedimentisphaeraceae bacterium JB056]